jgi:thiamine-phosphate pyrophosphorylase
MPEAAEWRACRPHWTITVAAHSLRALAAAHCAKADAALLSPVFATASHANAPAIGAMRTQLIVRQSPLPVYALGGVDARTVRSLTGSTFAGIAAIGALTP